MVLLDFVGDRQLSIPREGLSNAGLWRQLRAAARAAGAAGAFPAEISGGVQDDHLPFLEQGVPVDRPDRLQLPLLAPALRRPLRGVRAAASTRRGRPCSGCSLASDAHGTLGSREAAAGRSARVLRGRGPGSPGGRARAGAVRAAGLRPQGDRPQQARGRGAARPRRGVRGGGDRGAGGRDGRLLRARSRAQRARQLGVARPQDRRRDLPARDQGPRGGQEVRGGGLHDRARGPPGPRGGGGHDGRGARPLRPDRDRGGRGPARGGRPPPRSPTSPRPRCRSTRRIASSAGCASASRTSPVPRATTSVTPPPTARWPSARWRASAISCS